MSTKKNYSRYFIILQEDEKGYSTDATKFPTGYAKIERKNDKCKVSYYVQNLRKSKEPYHMVLICDRKTDKRLVNLGAINIDDYGRAEIAYEYNVESVADSSIPMENIKGAAIVKLDSSNVNGVLAGFVSGVKLDDWKSYAIIENSDRARKNEASPDVSNVMKSAKKPEEIMPEVNGAEDIEEDNEYAENNIFDEYEMNIEQAKNIEAKVDMDDSDDGLEEYEMDEEEALRHKKKKDKECNKYKHDNKEKHEDHEKCDNKENHENHEDEEKKENKECHEHKHDNKENIENNHCHQHKHEQEDEDNKECKKHKDNMKDKDIEDDIDDLEEFFEALADGFEEVKGTCPELGKCKWYKVNCKELENVRPNVEFNKYTMVYYPMVSYYPYIRRHGHYLMGHKCDSKGRVRYIVYAIPGTRDIQDQPFGGATGFVTWVYKNKDERDKNLGYWVMFYDFKNSTVVVPIKK